MHWRGYVYILKIDYSFSAKKDLGHLLQSSCPEEVHILCVVYLCPVVCLIIPFGNVNFLTFCAEN